jgi:hypothetical protein
MDLTQLQRPGLSSPQAFEALCVQLFRLWGRRTLGLRETRFAALHGAGGDHGVEAVHETQAGAVLGLQVKYHTPLDAAILKKLDDSVDCARKRYPGLVRYIVALPLDRSNKRKKSTSVDEVTRWENWETAVRKRHSGLDVVFWGKREIEDELARPEAVHFEAFFFGKAWLGQADFERRLGAVLTTGTFRHRYVADLHTEVPFEERLRRRLGDTPDIQDLEGHVERVIALGKRARMEIDRLPRLGVQYSAEEEDAAHRAGEAINDWLVDAQHLQDWLERGLQGTFDPRVLDGPLIAIAELAGLLKARSRTTEVAPTLDSETVLRRFVDRWQLLSRELAGLHRIGAPMVLAGPAGSGKTHALAHLAQAWVSAGRPAVLLGASSFDPAARSTVHALLSTMLGIGTASPEGLLAILEGAAEVAARAKERPGTRALLVIDGLDETPGHLRKWRDLLEQLHVYVSDFPRVQIVVSLRDGALHELLGTGRNAESPWVTIEADRTEVPLDCLFERYAALYNVSVPHGIDIRGWFTSPLHVRLFVQRYRGTMVPKALDASSISALFGDLLQEASKQLDGVGDERPCAPALLSLIRTIEAEQGRSLLESQALRVLEKALADPYPRSAQRATDVLAVLESWGFVVAFKVRSEDPLLPPDLHIAPAYEAVVDFALARDVLGAKTDPLPRLRDREYALELYALMRTEQDGSFDWLLNASDAHLEASPWLELYLAILAQVPPDLAAARRADVARLLIRSVPLRCSVISDLVVRVMRRGQHPFAPHFVHGVLAPLRVADRDLVWSGPSDLQAPAPWAGWGPDVLPNVTLRTDDPADGPPLLLAWATTSLERRKRDWARRELAGWMAEAPTEIPRLIQRLSESNDPQMHEDVVAALAVAVNAWDRQSAWADVASALREFYAGLPEDAKDDCVLRAGLWAVLMRGKFLQALDEAPWWSRVAPPGERESGEGGDERLFPVDRSIWESSSGKQWIDTHIVHSDLAWYVLGKGYEPFFDPKPKPPPEAIALVRAHASHLGLADESPAAFALAAVHAQASAWGWTDDVFHGEPLGGEPGERLGYDIAVLRQHPPSRHGLQSRVARPAEKYTWLAVNRLAGYLADRLPRADEDAFLTDLTGLGSQLPTIHLEPTREVKVLEIPDPDGWGPAIHLPRKRQVDDARLWRDSAPLPNEQQVASWLVASDPSQWLIPRRIFIATEPSSLVNVVIRISSVLAAPTARKRMLETIKGGGFPNDASLDSPGFYLPPALAIWAPWIHDKTYEGSLEHTSSELHFERVDAEGEGQEDSVWIPGESLRRQLRLSRITWAAGSDTESHAAVITDTEGNRAAQYTRWREGFVDFVASLILRRDAVLGALGGRSLFWHIRLIREPAPILRTNGRPLGRRTTDWLATMDATGRIVVKQTGDAYPDGDAPRRAPRRSNRSATR